MLDYVWLPLWSPPRKMMSLAATGIEKIAFIESSCSAWTSKLSWQPNQPIRSCYLQILLVHQMILCCGAYKSDQKQRPFQTEYGERQELDIPYISILLHPGKPYDHFFVVVHAVHANDWILQNDRNSAERPLFFKFRNLWQRGQACSHKTRPLQY